MWDQADWGWLQGEVRAAAAAISGQLRTLSDTSVRVPNLEWTAAELGGHIASLPRLYRDQHRIGTGFEPPADWAVFSGQARAHLTTTDAAELAELMVGEAETLLAPDDPNEPRLLYGRKTSVANTAAGLLTECILHGQDLGRLTGRKPSIERRQALAGLEQQMALAPVFVDPRKAAQLAGVYGLRFRGGSDFTYHVSDVGELTVERGRPDHAHARLNADPAAFLATSLGRANRVIAGFTGKIVAYGRKPWRMAQLGNVIVDGI